MVVHQSSSFQTDFEADILKAKPVFLLLRRKKSKHKHKLYIRNLSQYRTVRLGIKVVAFASTEHHAGNFILTSLSSSYLHIQTVGVGQWSAWK